MHVNVRENNVTGVGLPTLDLGIPGRPPLLPIIMFVYSELSKCN